MAFVGAVMLGPRIGRFRQGVKVLSAFLVTILVKS